MSPNEIKIIRNLGCSAFTYLQYIKQNPEKNSRMKASTDLNLSVKTIRESAFKLTDRNIITEVEIERDGSNMWHKKFIVNPENEWRV